MVTYTIKLSQAQAWYCALLNIFSNWFRFFPFWFSQYNVLKCRTYQCPQAGSEFFFPKTSCQPSLLFYFLSYLSIKKKKNPQPHHKSSISCSRKACSPYVVPHQRCECCDVSTALPCSSSNCKELQARLYRAQSVRLLATSRSNQWVLTTPQLNRNVTSKGLSLTISLHWCFCFGSILTG